MFQVSETPTLLSLHTGNKIDSLGSKASQNIDQIQTMFTTLLEYNEQGNFDIYIDKYQRSFNYSFAAYTTIKMRVLSGCKLVVEAKNFSS